MLTKEQNDLITLTDAGTPGGELMRRYWQPVALSEELSGDTPVPTRIFGEDLVLFRDPAQGRATGSRRMRVARPHTRGCIAHDNRADAADWKPKTMLRDGAAGDR